MIRARTAGTTHRAHVTAIARVGPLLAVTFLAVATLLGACTTGPGSPGDSQATESPDATLTSPTDDPSAEPTDEPTPEETLPTEPPLITEPPPSGEPAGECTGSQANRDFLVMVAEGVPWTVYCAVLPPGWHLQSGTYRRGYVLVAYESRSGGRIELSQGAFCGQTDVCEPEGIDAGIAGFGDLEGTLYSGTDGSWAVAVDPGAALSWLIVGRSIDQTDLLAIAASLARVEPQP